MKLMKKSSRKITLKADINKRKKERRKEKVQKAINEKSIKKEYCGKKNSIKLERNSLHKSKEICNERKADEQAELQLLESRSQP